MFLLVTNNIAGCFKDHPIFQVKKREGLDNISEWSESVDERSGRFPSSLPLHFSSTSTVLEYHTGT